jgi:hypothetical protein
MSVTFYISKDPKEITGPAIGSTKSILKSIQTYGPTIKRVIVTSSFAAITDDSKGFRPGYVYTEADWNPVSLSYTRIFRRLLTWHLDYLGRDA